MIRATIIIRVKYPEGTTDEEVEDDKAEFMVAVKNRYWPTVPAGDIDVEYTHAEVKSHG